LVSTRDELPKIKEVLAEQLVEPTIIRNTELEAPKTEEKDTEAEAEEEVLLSVTEEGELIENENDEENNA
jgi:segregation and condensation protein B